MLTIRAGAHRLRLSEAADMWYVGGGPFEDDSFGYTGRAGAGASGLATVVDLSVTLTPVNWAKIEAYVANAFEGDVIRGIYPAAGSGRLAYLEIEFRR